MHADQIFPGHGRGGIDWKVNLGIAILGITLVISLVAVVAFLLLPLALSAQARAGRRIYLLYFVTIGLGYIMVEIALIQRFVLFLGHPTYALTVVVFLMLLSSGLGSLLSRRWIREPRQVAGALVFIAAILSIYVFSLPNLLASQVGLPIVIKLAISAILIIPLGFAMGMPFPTGLRAVSTKAGNEPLREGAVEWAWAMNAASSVLGSVLAIVVAIQFGLNMTLTCAVAAYVCALALMLTASSWTGIGARRAHRRPDGF